MHARRRRLRSNKHHLKDADGNEMDEIPELLDTSQAAVGFPVGICPLCAICCAYPLRVVDSVTITSYSFLNTPSLNQPPSNAVPCHTLSRCLAFTLSRLITPDHAQSCHRIQSHGDSTQFLGLTKEVAFIAHERNSKKKRRSSKLGR